jgi:hypothetical protein
MKESLNERLIIYEKNSGIEKCYIMLLTAYKPILFIG